MKPIYYRHFWATISLCWVCMYSAVCIGATGDRQQKVLYVDSYHQGYPWSTGIAMGVQKILGDEELKNRIDLKIFRMDTKRNQSVEFKNEAALKAKGMIDSWKPDVVIASDDNASKYLIVPYFKDKSLPFVFCGVNWDASVYGFPFTNVTGIVEVSLIPQLLETLAAHSKGERIGLLGADNLSNRKEAANYHKIFNIELTKEVFVNTFEELKTEFKKIQTEVDMLILAPPSFLKGDLNKKEARAFFEEQTIIPTGCVEDWITPYTLVGYTKVAEEQGESAATMAVKILDGQSAKDIPMVKNKKANVFLNMTIARKMRIIFPMELINRAFFVK